MKVKLTETQYNRLLKYINEVVQPQGPTQLSGFFNKNPDTAFFSIVKLTEKTQDESEYLFKYEKLNGIPTIKDMNQGTVTKGCESPANLDTMIFDDEFTLTFSDCKKTLKINNVVGIRLFNEQHDTIDEMKFDNTSTEDKESLVDRYNDELKTANIDDEVYFKTPKKEYDGTVLNKTSDTIEIEIHERGKNTNILLYINLDNDGFYEENGQIYFQGMKKDVKNNTETDFNIPIKSFSSTNKGKTQNPANNQDDKNINPKSITPLSDEELEAQARLAYDEILNDKDLQRAFYRKPSFWNLFMAELKGEKAPGKGIYPTMQIVKGYKSNKIDTRLKGQFVEGEQVYYQPYHNKDIHIYSDKKELLETIPAGAESKAKVEHLNLGDNTKQLVHRENYNKLIITIKEPTEVQNVYLCDLRKENKTGAKGKKVTIGTEKNVYLTFNPKSKGYRPLKLTQTQTQTKP